MDKQIILTETYVQLHNLLFEISLPNIIITQKKIHKRAIQKSEQPLTKFEREYWAAAIIEELQAAEQHDRLNKLN